MSFSKYLRTIFIITIILIISVVSSCKKFVDIPSPPNKLLASDVFSNDASATGLVTGIYTRMMISTGFASGSYESVTQLSGLSADEFINLFTNSDNIQFANNSLTATNGALNTLWSEIYTYIYTTNVILEGLQQKNGVSSPVSQQLNGEAKFIRAFCYFYLTNLFGDVPLHVTSDYQVNAIATRTPSTQVYQQIVSDLKDAQNLLGNDYSYSKGERIRPNKWVATALLSRVYLYTQQWDSAEAEATTVINNSSLYSLNSLDSVFLKNSNEAIWQLLPVSPGLNTNEGNLFILTSAPTLVSLSTFIMSEFEPGDNRLINWVGTYSDGINTWYFPYKYKVQASSTLTEYSMVIRLAELYLIAAESEANGAGNGILSAINNLNIIRNRAGLNPYSGPTNQDSVLNAIYHERQVELFSEWGHRWLDLNRTGRSNAILGSEKIPWVATDTLYPIPFSEIQNNSKITQNTGY